jgi:hypothetical protein
LHAELEHRTAVERGAAVEVVTEDTEDGGLAVWIVADGVVAASARLALLTR